MLKQAGAGVHAYTDPVVKYHAKYLIADDGPAVVASLNFTRKCFERTCDALVVTHDPEIVSGLHRLMAADRDGQPMPDGLSQRLIVGPERARRQFTALIEEAQSSIRLIDSKLSDPDLLRRLEARRAKGVTVEMLDSKRVGGLKSHGKIMCIDDRLAVVGSVALSAPSLDLRREVAITVDDPNAVAEIVTCSEWPPRPLWATRLPQTRRVGVMLMLIVATMLVYLSSASDVSAASPQLLRNGDGVGEATESSDHRMMTRRTSVTTGSPPPMSEAYSWSGSSIRQSGTARCFDSTFRPDFKERRIDRIPLRQASTAGIPRFRSHASGNCTATAWASKVTSSNTSNSRSSAS